MKIRNNIVILLVYFILVIIVFAGCNWNSNESEEITEQSLQETKCVNIPCNIVIQEGETIKIVVPEIVLSGIRVNDKAERMNQYRSNMEKQGVVFTNIYLDDKENTCVELDKNQLEDYCSFAEKRIGELIDCEVPVVECDIPVDINEKFDAIIYYVPENCGITDFGLQFLWAEQSLALSQTLMGVQSERWRIKHTIIYKDTGIEMFEFESGTGVELDITNEEWEQKMEEAKELAEGDD